MRKNFRKTAAVAVILLLVPYIITVFMNGTRMKISKGSALRYVKVQVGNSSKKVPWEEYMIGLLAKEIDTTYGEEALKAQAILTRTNIYRQVEENKDVVFKEEYMTYREMEDAWGERQARKTRERLQKAIDDTDGKTILYDGKLIMASFHPLSNGSTRNGNEVLKEEKYPYLKQRECPKDVESEYQLQTLTLTYNEVKEYCRPFLLAVDKEKSSKPFAFEDFEVKERDAAGYVTKIRIGDNIYPGEEFRSAVGIPSSCFTFHDQGDSIKITTKGVGHGLGMSQYTANEMAKEGKTCEEILQYFFEGTEIKEVAEILLNIE